MADIRKHELISQLFWSPSCVVAIRISTGEAMQSFDCPNRTAAAQIVSKTPEIERRVPIAHSYRYQRAQCHHRQFDHVRRAIPADSQTDCGISVRNAHIRES